MDNPDSVVPPGGFCENCGHFAGRHDELRCHFPVDEKHPNPCPCPGLVWKNEMYTMDMENGPQVKIPCEFDHLKGYWLPILPVSCKGHQHVWDGNKCTQCGSIDVHHVMPPTVDAVLVDAAPVATGEAVAE